MYKINSEMFNFQYFLGGRKKVADLESAARLYMGATKYDDAIYSNVKTNKYIKINETINTLSILVPSTINANEPIDNKLYVTDVIAHIRTKYNFDNMKFYNTVGSWLNEDTGEVIIENITIVTVELEKISLEDIKFFIAIANDLKVKMTQQAISLNINDSLCLV